MVRSAAGGFDAGGVSLSTGRADRRKAEARQAGLQLGYRRAVAIKGIEICKDNISFNTAWIANLKMTRVCNRSHSSYLGRW
jgi:hypothetical protein